MAVKLMKRYIETLSPAKKRVLMIATRTLLTTALALILSLLLAEPFSMSTSSIFSSPEKNDFQMTDMFAQIADQRPVRVLDDRLVIVNIGLADRQKIGEALQLISLCAPRAVALDINFKDTLNAEADNALLEGLAANPGIILPLALADDGRGIFSIAASPFFYDDIKEPAVRYGAANLPAKSAKATIREYVVDYKTDGGKIPSFVTQIAQAYDPVAARKLRDRKENLGVTAYHSREYKIIGIDDIEDNAEQLSDKIVMLGALDDASDMHATPVNAYMAGVLIHAHALSTILDGIWYRRTPPAFDYMIAIVICLVITCLSFTLHAKFKGLILRLLQVLMVIIAVRIGYGIFIDSNILFNFTYTFLIIAFGLFAVDIYNGLEEIVKIINRKISNRKSKNNQYA